MRKPFSLNVFSNFSRCIERFDFRLRALLYCSLSCCCVIELVLANGDDEDEDDIVEASVFNGFDNMPTEFGALISGICSTSLLRPNDGGGRSFESF